NEEKVAEETPPLETAPLAPEPAAQLPQPHPDKNEKSQEKADGKVAHEEASRRANANPITTAPPPSEAKLANAAAAPGLSTISEKAQANWQKSLVAHINRYKRYPTEARTHKVEGIVSVEFTLDRSGQILSSRVAHSSGSVVLDEEAVALLR